MDKIGWDGMGCIYIENLPILIILTDALSEIFLGRDRPISLSMVKSQSPSMSSVISSTLSRQDGMVEDVTDRQTLPSLDKQVMHAVYCSLQNQLFYYDKTFLMPSK